MAIDITKVRWSGYNDRVGPSFGGIKSLQVPLNPTFLQKCMGIVSSVEGHIDAVNMYDSGIVSLGTVQWIERGNMSVSDMMGAVAEKCGVDYVLKTLSPALTQMPGSTFRKNNAGKWRFFMKKGAVEFEVSSTDLQQEFFLGCSGKKGDWTPAAQVKAKTWCACFASIWDDDDACEAQIDFSSKRILAWFITPNAKKLLFADPGEDSWRGALKAIYVSFAVNSPAIADRQLVIGVNSSKFEKWSQEWCLDVISQLVFGSGIGIWPMRYVGLIKSSKKYFGIDLPQSVKELGSKSWQSNVIVHQNPAPVIVPAVDVNTNSPVPFDPTLSTDIIVSAVEQKRYDEVPLLEPAAKPTFNPNITAIIVTIIGAFTYIVSLVSDCGK